MEELDQVAGNAEDEIGERIAAIRESELLYGAESLLAIYGPMIVHICGSPHKFKVCVQFASSVQNSCLGFHVYRTVLCVLRPLWPSANSSASALSSATSIIAYCSRSWKPPRTLASVVTPSSHWVTSRCPSAISSTRTATSCTRGCPTMIWWSRRTRSWC